MFAKANRGFDYCNCKVSFFPPTWLAIQMTISWHEKLSVVFVQTNKQNSFERPTDNQINLSEKSVFFFFN